MGCRTPLSESCYAAWDVVLRSLGLSIPICECGGWAWVPTGPPRPQASAHRYLVSSEGPGSESSRSSLRAGLGRGWGCRCPVGAPLASWAASAPTKGTGAAPGHPGVHSRVRLWKPCPSPTQHGSPHPLGRPVLNGGAQGAAQRPQDPQWEELCLGCTLGCWASL